MIYIEMIVWRFLCESICICIRMKQYFVFILFFQYIDTMRVYNIFGIAQQCNIIINVSYFHLIIIVHI